METENTVNSVWQKSKLLIKGLLIGALILLLMIPSYFVQNVISEREERNKEAFKEVSGKWADSQLIVGPVLVLPYKYEANSQRGVISNTRFAYILPEQLTINSQVQPEKRYRGIYEVLLYSSRNSFSGKFGAIPFERLKLDPADVIWDDAHVVFGIQDGGGLEGELELTWNDSVVKMTPSSASSIQMKEEFSVPVSVTPNKEFNFSISIALNGSGQLLFTPVGRETNAKLSSSWPDPGFTGGQLPDYEITDSGFVANWKNFSHTRNYPQEWKDGLHDLKSSAIGSDMIIPVNAYQKTMRSVKYSMLCIVLTFAAFFIIETVNKLSVHPFQYALIGLALILFYTLLLSISEYTGFNTAYVISTIAIAGLIGWFVKGVLNSSKLSAILSVILVLVYSYIFTILQLTDYSLLLGSVGLFLTLGVIMHFSRKIRW